MGIKIVYSGRCPVAMAGRNGSSAQGDLMGHPA